MPANETPPVRPGFGRSIFLLSVAAALVALAIGYVRHSGGVTSQDVPPTDKPSPAAQATPSAPPRPLNYRRRQIVDTGGYTLVQGNTTPWKPDASLKEIADVWRHGGQRILEAIDKQLAIQKPTGAAEIAIMVARAGLMNWEGESRQASKVLEDARALAEADPALATDWLYTIIYFQGITGIRCGENENCVMCQGESACIFPISKAAVHTDQRGSRAAVRYFSEYLDRFPDDLEVRWLLNLAHMTLGEYPQGVDPKCVIPLDNYLKSEFDIGRFHDIGHLVGVNRLNQAGGAIMDDFNNDGLLDIAITSFDPTQRMALYLNKGDGTFEDAAEKAGLADQLGGLNCVQADYNNDGNLDIFVIRGAWLNWPMRPSLLRNNGDGTFTDVTKEAGLMEPANAIAAQWADYDNDGLLDLYLCCENNVNRLYHNKGNGTFEEVAAKAGVQGNGQGGKGCAWIDYDNDGYPDLFVNHLHGTAQLFHNNRDGTFTEVTKEMGIDGPRSGFSCWAFDFDNDGYLDIFATSYNRTLADIVKGMMGQPHARFSNKLYRNMGGKGFQDVTKEYGLDMVFATMGSNFGDFDNDGFLDMYLGTGDPELSMLVPNRMFKNVAGKRFAEITASSGTGHLQKGHGVACGDWDRDGNVDIFIEMGGALNGDRYHNVLFQNPGHDNSWLTVKLIGKKTNRSAIGARIKAVTAGGEPLTVHRHVSSGSSFGGNPLQQTIGLGKATRVATLEITWPTSGTKQVFHDVAVNQAIEVTEFADNYRKLDWKPIPVPH
jgi:hypothetical protein